MKKISVKLRITLWYAIAMIVVACVVLIAMFSVGSEFIKRDIESGIVRTVDDSARMLRSPIGMRGLHKFRFFDRGVHMALYDSDGKLIAGQIPFEFTDTIEFYDSRLLLHRDNGDSYYIRDKKLLMPDNTYMWLRGVTSISAESAALASNTKLNIIFVVIMIIITVAGGYIILSRAFVPVKRIQKTAERISAGTDLSERIGLGDGKDEIHALAATIDKMLGRIEKNFEREKQFTSDASHELRTPVAVILSECEYMKTCAKTVEEYAESADSVQRQAEKMQKLITELLTISRMDNNTLKTSFECIDVSELLEFVCDEQEEINNGTLVRNINSEIMAEGDKSLLARLFINLISNAFIYGKDYVEVTLVKENDEVVFTVRDNGDGIAQEHIDKIWERFYQADPSRSANNSMGLGLSMVRWISGCHNGTVGVKSEVGKGSEFTFRFPAKQKGDV